MNRGFTLIELLLVIAIVGALIGLLLPGLGAAGGLACRAACASHLRGMVAAVRVYAGQHEGRLPVAEPTSRTFPHEQHWFLNPILLEIMGVPLCTDAAGRRIGPPDSGSLLICPGHLRPQAWRDGTLLEYGLSYGMNGTWGLGGRPDHLRQRYLEEFPKASSVMVFMDAQGLPDAPGIVLYHGCPKDNLDFRHQGRANAAFLDGHVTAVTEAEVPMGMENRYEPFWGTEKR